MTVAPGWNVEDLCGREVSSADGISLGVVKTVFLNDMGAPRWAGIRLAEHHRETLLPLAEAYVTDGRLCVSCTSAQVSTAPQHQVEWPLTPEVDQLLSVFYQAPAATGGSIPGQRGP